MILEWTDEQVDDYDGHDIILLTGAPGSKWSNTYKQIYKAKHEDLNMHDASYSTYAYRDHTIHLGPYWGPGHNHGNNFDDIENLSKRQILNEFTGPYETWDKVKIIKSHWFSYNLDDLIDMFPKLRIVMCYLPDTECFLWWKSLGGFDITYPYYKWYKDDAGIIKQISAENHNILQFCAARNVESSMVYNARVCETREDNTKYWRYTLNDLLTQLGLSTIEGGPRAQEWCMVFVYNPEVHKLNRSFTGSVLKFGNGFDLSDVECHDDTYELYNDGAHIRNKAFDRFNPQKWKSVMREPYNLFSKGMGQQKYVEMYERINAMMPTLVVDAGCGRNQHKRFVKNLIGFDPQPFKDADLQFTILNAPFLPGTVDAVLCLGSLQFISKDYIDEQLGVIVGWLKPGGLIEMRVATRHKWLPDPTKCVNSMYVPWTDSMIAAAESKYGLEMIQQPFSYQDEWVGLKTKEDGDEKERRLWTWKKYK